MNALFADLGLSSSKALLTALVLPPVPLLLLVLMGAALLPARRRAGWLLVGTAITALWLGSCFGFAEWLMRSLLQPPPALDAKALAGLKSDAARKQPIAIVVLGGGIESFAPEYGMSNLNSFSLERLRYGVWLAREIGVPLGFSGGVGYARSDGMAEAEVAARVAAREFARPLRWIEGESRDTRENAARTIALLKNDPVRRIVLVTHAWHMPRARRAFEDAVRAAGLDAAIVPAPIAWASRVERPLLRWLPSSEGFELVRFTVRERLGLLFGA